MLPVTPDILNTVSFFQNAFTIVIALAIGESLKQFVADKAAQSQDRSIHWDRLPALISFLLLAFSFFHGMNRYFFLAYTGTKGVSEFYGRYVIFDGVSFITMSALFFTMSRTLAAAQWRRYFGLILFLMIVDSIWVWVAVGLRGFPVGSWLTLNSCVGFVLVICLISIRSSDVLGTRIASSICTLTIATTTCISYYINWGLFFPS